MNNAPTSEEEAGIVPHTSPSSSLATSLPGGGVVSNIAPTPSPWPPLFVYLHTRTLVLWWRNPMKVETCKCSPDQENGYNDDEFAGTVAEGCTSLRVGAVTLVSAQDSWGRSSYCGAVRFSTLFTRVIKSNPPPAPPPHPPPTFGVEVRFTEWFASNGVG